MTDYRLIVSEEEKVDLDFWRNAMKLNTCIPAIVDEFDPTTQRVSAVPAIMAKVVKQNGAVEYIQCPKITNIPVAITKGAGLYITYPIAKGENCTLLFSQRSIDNFLLEGGIQRPFDTDTPQTTTIRCMDMTDAMCFPGLITNKETLGAYATDAIEIRNTAGTVKVSVKENSLILQQESATVQISGGNIEMTAATINITGTSAVNINSPASTVDTIPFLTHVHDFTTPGPKDSTSGGVYQS